MRLPTEKAVVSDLAELVPSVTAREAKAEKDSAVVDAEVSIVAVVAAEEPAVVPVGAVAARTRRAVSPNRSARYSRRFWMGLPRRRSRQMMGLPRLVIT